MDSNQLVLVVLAAVALGALLPLAVQLSLTLRAARTMIAGVEPRLSAALSELSSAAAAANRSMSALDAAALKRTAESVVEMGALAKKARELTASLEMASAVGAAAAPAIAAIIRAWRAPDESEAPEAGTPNHGSHNSQRPVHGQEMDQQ